ncbi:85/88 kDa calcium-independent phospholipase A2 [Parelaphostrongylus tenuis]|uniref:85/88 kDa calcium-independent phospholipase A2 n=1 Tax=Parelaphostrongylus tenuis TaxID=148309 RepID=A0AAD5N3T2_PARTN|nr:85/88 kDa calcium-independent phospholipase A2 [Parelaphostrongylus tenuis]
MADSQILSLHSIVDSSQAQSSSSASDDAELLEDLMKDAEDSTDVNEEEVQTPPPSPTNGRPRPSLFSLAQVSSKLGELWSSARESIFGEDYWIPSDPNEIALFPLELLRAHKVIFPADDHNSQLRVVQGSVKNKPAEPLHHVVFSLSELPNAPSYSLFRSTVVEDAVDLCRRCVECKILFRILDRSKDTKKPISDLISKLKQYPLYRMIHIAIACDRLDLFDDANIEYMNSEKKSFQSLMKMMIQPEGKYPLHLAIEMHRLKIVRRMLKLGTDASVKDINGNNAIHYGSLASVQMLELLWEFDECHVLINQTNNEGYVPVMLAIRAANPRCFATLLNFGAELSMRVQGRNPLFEAMQSKGKNADIIKAIIEASPDLIKERDSSGNTALHAAMYKAPLMGLLFLKSKEIDLNAKNCAGQTPLHIFTHKGEIGLMMTLLSYCCDIDAQDNDGNTALHIAVSKRNNEATRLLLCLGANPNLSNSNDETPRHLAARLKETTLLKSLIMCGSSHLSPEESWLCFWLCERGYERIPAVFIL